MISHQDLIENKFLRTYIRIIEKARKTVYSGYTEKHHVVPRSMGGTDEESNLVKVSAREHFILHCLLARCTTGPSLIKMTLAVHMISGAATANKRSYMNSRLFEANKIAYTKAVKEFGGGRPAYKNAWFKNSEGLVKKFPLKEEEKLLSEGWVRGGKHEERTRELGLREKPRISCLNCRIVTTTCNISKHQEGKNCKSKHPGSSCCYCDQPYENFEMLPHLHRRYCTSNPKRQDYLDALNSPEAKKKRGKSISKAHADGKYEKLKPLLRELNIGKTLSEETKKKISEAALKSKHKRGRPKKEPT